MKFAFYCREMRGGGSRAVALGLLQAIARREWGHEFIAYAPDGEDFKESAGGELNVVTVQTKGGYAQAFAHRFLLNELRSNPVDALFMGGNRGLIGSPCPQVTLIHNSWLLYPETLAWRRSHRKDLIYRKIRNVFLRRGVRASDVLASQTPVMLKRLHEQFRIPYTRLALVPNSVTAPPPGQEIGDSGPATQIKTTGHKVKAICLARYYTQKNLEIFLAVADELLSQGRTDIGIFVTIAADQGEGARAFLEALELNGRSRVVHNLGPVPMSAIPSIYASVDALALPTLLESFSNTYLDAMYAGVPIITSDLDFARTVCGDAAVYIDPLDAHAMIQALDSVATDPQGWQSRIAAGHSRTEYLGMTWDEIAERVVELLECVARRQPVDHLLRHPWVEETIALPSR